MGLAQANAELKCKIFKGRNKAWVKGSSLTTCIVEPYNEIMLLFGKMLESVGTHTMYMHCMAIQ